MTGTQPVRWGILGPGRIARKFAQALAELENAELQAVGSRSAQRAEQFGEEFAVPRRYGSYAGLVADEQVDVIYVATPHPMHKSRTLLALEAGKAVLCEKPLAVNAAEAREMVRLARDRGLFLMEAMWTRFVPAIVRLRELLAEGAIGEIRMILADFGYRGGDDPKARHLDPELGGGALLDVGVYPISLASMILGPPAHVSGLADIGRTGVDEQAGVVLSYGNGALAVLAAAVRTDTPGQAHIVGTEGRIAIEKGWWRGSRMTIVRSGRAEQIDIPTEGNGMGYEAAEVARCLDQGRTESPVMPLDESVQIMETMDRIRRQWNLKYPGERVEST